MKLIWQEPRNLLYLKKTCITMVTPFSVEKVSVACIPNPEMKTGPPVLRISWRRSPRAHSRAPGSRLRTPPRTAAGPARDLATLLSQPATEGPPAGLEPPPHRGTEAAGCTAPWARDAGTRQARGPRTNAGRSAGGRGRAVFTGCQDPGPRALVPPSVAGPARVLEPRPAFLPATAVRCSPGRPGWAILPPVVATGPRGPGTPAPCGATGPAQVSSGRMGRGTRRAVLGCVWYWCRAGSTRG